MTATHILQATFSQALGKGMPAISNMRGLYYFGSGSDGFNGNRATGGVAPTTFGTVSYAANYAASLGYNGTAACGINTNIVRDATMLSAGWTWCCVARAVAGGAIGGTMMEDSGGAGPPLAGTLCGMAFQGSTSFNAYLHAGGSAIRATLVNSRSNDGGWHFYAATYAGGALGNWSFAEYTDIPAGAPVTYTQTVAMLAAANCPVFGNNVPNGPANYTVLADVAFGMVAQGVMLQTDIATLAAAVRPWLARRGIVA